MNTFFWGAGRAGSIAALEYVIKKANVIGCSCDEDNSSKPLVKVCDENNIPLYSKKSLIESINDGKIIRPEWGLCYSYHSLIPKVLIDFPLNGIINFHPSPLPFHRGIAGASYAKYNGEEEWGVSVHYMDEAFDTGDIITTDRFAVDPMASAIMFDDIIQRKMLKLYKTIVDSLLVGMIPHCSKQIENNGHYYSRKQLDNDKKVSFLDDADCINRKIEAFWFPPYEGAYIEINGIRYTLLNQSILAEVAMLYHEHFRKGFD